LLKGELNNMPKVDHKDYFIKAGDIDMSPEAVAIMMVGRRGPWARAFGRQWEYEGYMPEGVSRETAWKEVKIAPKAESFILGVRPAGGNL
jgi:hypothetical protein